jgi:hypothetical protein
MTLIGRIISSFWLHLWLMDLGMVSNGQPWNFQAGSEEIEEKAYFIGMFFF